MMRVLTVTCLAVLTVTGTAKSQTPRTDGVVGRNRISVPGTIVEVARDHVTIQTRTGKKVFPANEIQRVSFAEDPPELRRAREAIGRGQLETALSELQRISTDGISRREVLQDIAFYKAYCAGTLAISGGGDKVAAVKALREFQENPANQNSYHYYDAVRLLGDLAVALGRNDAAAKYYQLLETAPWPDYQMRAKVLLARSLYADGQTKQALEKFESVAASTRDDVASREQKTLAQIGKAKCLAELGQADEGIAIVNKLIAENDPQQSPQLFARAYNALGVCYLKAKRPKDALLAFLHVDLLFFQDADAHAEALYYLSKLWRDVNRSERALKARSLLQQNYGGTAWANKQ